MDGVYTELDGRPFWYKQLQLLIEKKKKKKMSEPRPFEDARIIVPSISPTLKKNK